MMEKLRKHFDINSNWVALLIFIVVAIVYLHPIFRNFSYWGIYDWDSVLSHTGMARKTILTYHQIPLWKPYHLGGSALLAAYGNGLSLLSPFFIFVLLFGTVYGLKLQAIAYLITGMMGMFLLGKQLNLKRYSLYLPAFVFTLSSYFALIFTMGNPDFLDFIWLPWIFLYYLKCLPSFRMKYLILCSIFLTLMLFSGAPCPVLFTLLFLMLYSGLGAIRQRKLLPLKVFSLILIMTLLLGAIKLFPGVEHQREFPRTTPLELVTTKDTIPLRFFHLTGGLLSRRQTLSDEKIFWGKPLFPERLFGWPGYGAYVGLIPFALFIIGLPFGLKRYPELIIVGFIFLLLSLDNCAPVNLWKILHSLPIFSNMRFPIRSMVMFIFVLAVLAGVTLSKVENGIKKVKVKKWTRIFVLCIVLVVLIDLVAVNSRVFKEAFVFPPMPIEKRTDNFYQTYDTTDCYRSMYPAFLENKGIVNAYDETPRSINALPISSSLYRGESFLLNNKGSSPIIYFSPNVVKIEVNTQGNDILVLNQNYDTGWRVKGTKNNRVISTKGLVSVAVTPEDHLVTFYYLPASFIVGAIITLLTIVIILLYRFRKLSKRYFKYSIVLLFTILFLYLLFGIKYFAGASPENRPLILAKQYEWDEKYSQIAKEYEKVIQTYPYYAEGYRCLGYCYLKEKRPDKTIEAIMQAMKLQPMAWSNYRLLGVTYYEKEEYNRAIIALKEAIRLKPGEWSNYNLLGASYFQKKEYDKAIEALKETIRLVIDEWSSYNLLGTSYSQKKEYDKAIAALKEAIRLKPGEWSNYNNLGRVYLETEDYDKAISAYEKALALKPEAEYISIVKQNLAIAHLKRLIELNPADPENITRYNQLGEIYQEKRAYHKAWQAYERASQLNPSLKILQERIEEVKSKLDQEDEDENRRKNGYYLCSLEDEVYYK